MLKQVEVMVAIILDGEETDAVDFVTKALRKAAEKNLKKNGRQIDEIVTMLRFEEGKDDWIGQGGWRPNEKGKS